MAERETVPGDWRWRLRAMVVGEIFGGRHALCPFDWGKYDTSLLNPWFFDLLAFNFHSL